MWLGGNLWVGAVSVGELCLVVSRLHRQWREASAGGCAAELAELLALSVSDALGIPRPIET